MKAVFLPSLWSSADWMPRNLDKRVEILFPLENERIREEALHILSIQMEDNVKAHILQPDGSYEKIDKRGKALLCAQDYFCEEAVKQAQTEPEETKRRVFIPAEPLED